MNLHTYLKNVYAVKKQKKMNKKSLWVGRIKQETP